MVPTPPQARKSRTPKLDAALGVKPKPPLTSASEQAALREARLKAAESRGNAWDSKVGAARTRTALVEKREREARQTNNQDIGAAAMSEDSKRAFEAARSKEAKTAEELGYNPYESISSTSSGAISGPTGSSGADGGGGASGGRGGGSGEGSGSCNIGGSSGTDEPASSTGETLATQIQDAEAGDLGSSEQLQEALALLSSQPKDVALGAVAVSSKLLGNLAQNFSDEKFHKVRLANKVGVLCPHASVAEPNNCQSQQ